jgi:2-phosphosulfolactate phosphatase
MWFDQSDYNIRCEWGEEGVKVLAPISDAIIIVDVMSFSTCVTTAAAHGGTVYPHRSRDNTAQARAQELGAELAKGRGGGLYSLSPETMLKVVPGMRLVLPSLNGATLSLTTGSTATFAGCLRNAEAVARAVGTYGRNIAVIPAGERWERGESLRPALEDLIGAGAIISHLPGRRSPEADIAVAVFESVKPHLIETLRMCCSGRQLSAANFDKDIDFIAALNVENVAPKLMDGYYTSRY